METKQPHKPCAHCPFLISNDYMLTAGRKAELYQAFERDSHFHCHKTLDYEGADEDGPDTSGGKICAGSIIACDKAGMGMSQMARIASRIGLLDLALVDFGDPNVVNVEDWNNEIDWDDDEDDDDYEGF